MLSCELCCSFRAVWLPCLILLQQSSLKKPFISQMLCVGGFGLYFWMSVEVSCPARRQTSHCLPAEAPPSCCVRFAPLLQALPCCCCLQPAAMGYALWRSLSVVVGCLGNGSLCQQWACTSVGVNCLGNDGRPSPTELHHPGFSCALREPLHPERLESPFCLSHCATPNTVSLESPGLAHCPSPVQSQVQPSQVSDCKFNRAPGPVRFVQSAV